MTPWPRLRRLPPLASAIPVWVLVIGLLTTAAAGYYSVRSARANDRIRFENAVEHVSRNISSRVDTYIALLRAGAGLFAGSGEVSQEEFSQFAARLDLRGRYPGIQGIGFAVRVPASRLDGFIARVRASGRPDFTVWPDHPRDVYFPIVYLEPEDRRNRAALGYDMFTEPVRHRAMQTAARTGTAAATGKVTLVQEIDSLKQAGFLIYAPVYDSHPVTPDGRELLGFVYSPFRAGDFISAVMATTEQRPVAITVYDGAGPPDPGRLLFASQSARDSDHREPRFTGMTTVDVAGRSWTVVVRSLPEFERSFQSRLLPWILGVGLLVTVGLTWATYQEVQARAAAELAAARLRVSEEALRESEAKLLRLVDAERRAHAEAEAASRAKDEFLATLSHELRTPLNAILGWTNMLESGRLNEQQRVRAMDVISRSARTQADLIEDLLDVSRIITGKLAIDMHAIGLAAPVRATLDAVRPAAEAKGIRIAAHLEADPPVLGDPDRLQQVAWNLLSNAIKFTPSGGRVSVSLNQADGQGELKVSDTGIGIAPAFLPYVFERFQQQDSSTTRAHGGMGLGLAIVRHLVESHGGTVQAESAGEGHGATFVVRLPMRAEAPGDSLRDHRPARPRQLGTDLEGLRLLVVDDDADAREVMEQVLTAHGASVHTAGSAEEALAVLDRGGVDVVLSDIGMPETDGYGLMQQLRSHPSVAVRGVPVIAVTAYAGEGDREAALAAGFHAHLPKPIDVDALREAVRRARTVPARPPGTGAGRAG